MSVRFRCPTCGATLPDRRDIDLRLMVAQLGLPPCECGDDMEWVDQLDPAPQHFRVVQMGPGRRTTA